ncbi:MAG: PEP/pyruvate-binding domain-containing protein [Solirubrobacterales bacterium]|nr:PEP/pyruvate-binding domain-containing protein [Solirubrobacterales bacterium]
MSAAAGGPHGRALHGLRRSDAPAFGGKSTGLGELLSAQIPVPPGFALSTTAFAAFMRASDLDHVADEALAPVLTGDVEATREASREIAAAMSSAPLPGDVRDELAARYDELAASAGVQSPPVAVRSSAVGEDSEDATFAGQQETRLWVRGVEDVCAAVRDCWTSLFSPTAISYRARLGERSRPAMGAIIQLMVDAAVSGVMFTCNPVSGDPSMVAINASWGLGLAVVGGEVTPDDYLVSKVTGEIVREQLGGKHVQYVPSVDGHGAELVEVPVPRRELACLDAEMLAALIDLGRRVERHFGSHQDIEWAIARAGVPPENVFVVQSRPVTTVPRRVKPTEPPPSALALVMGTFGAAQTRTEEER